MSSSPASRIAIRCERIGKHFSDSIDPYQALHAKIEQFLRLRLGRRPNKDSEHSRFWALREVSFEVPQGEILGIIGANGAGKSCLLRILAGVTKPSEGAAELSGPVGSILQLGLFIHGDLSGRENIYHCSALLRIARSEVDRRFDSLVELAGIEKFLDQQVKFYSTGMRMRLAFSVTLLSRAPILLIDEALSIGDQAFRSRSVQILEELRASGRTIVMASHELDLVEKVCGLVMELKNGRVVRIGSPVTVIAEYKSKLAKITADTQNSETR